MQQRRGGPGGRGPERPNLRTLGRAIQYIPRYRRIALLAYGSLLVATAAQLMVPQLIQSIIDTLVAGFTGSNPGGLAGTILGLPSVHGRATQGLIVAMIAIIVFAALRAVFAFGQGYNAERISQNVAFDFRNELFAKIQRLSFSYHDRNQTGQLMIRATDDVEKVRLFIGPGPGDGAAGGRPAGRHAGRPLVDQPRPDAGHPADPADRLPLLLRLRR